MVPNDIDVALQPVRDHLQGWGYGYGHGHNYDYGYGYDVDVALQTVCDHP